MEEHIEQENKRKAIGRFSLYLVGIIINVIFWSRVSIKIWDLIYDPSMGATLNRIGLILQILSIGAVIPNLVEKDKIQAWDNGFKNLYEQVVSLILGAKKFHQEFSLDILFQDGPIKKMNDVAKSLAILLMVLTAFSMLKKPSDDMITFLVGASCAVILFLLPVFIWMGVRLIQSFPKVTLPKFVLDIYLVANLLITFTAMIVSLPVVMFLAFIFPAIKWLSNQPIELALARITAPLLAIGSLLEFISTYYR